MAILRERVAWTKPRPANETRRSSDLTPQEQENVRAALRFLSKRQGGWRALAKAMDAAEATVRLAVSKRGGVSAGLALRAARAAEVPVENLLDGTWPPDGACPHCGRCQR